MGLTGFCFSIRRPCICNLYKIGNLANKGELSRDDLFKMPRELHEMVRSDRTWLASVPIFDPYATYPKDMGARYDHPIGVGGKHYHPLKASVDGAVLGVLNLDAALPYEELGIDPDPAINWTNVQIRSTIRLLESAARDIGRVLSDAFAVKALK